MTSDLAGSITALLRDVAPEDVAAAFRSFLADPTRNVGALMAAVAIVVLILLVIVLFFLYVLMPAQRRVVKIRRYASAPTAAAAVAANEMEHAAAGAESGGRPLGRHPSRGRVVRFLGSGAGLCLIAVLAFAVLYTSTSSNSFCVEACHAGSATVRAARDEGHAACKECHERGGVVGVVGDTVSRLRMVAWAANGASPGDPLPVASRECLRCHADLLTETVTSKAGIRVSHREIAEGGDPCTACHPRLGHEPSTYSRGMEPCIICHDTVTAPADCALCHTTQNPLRPKEGAPAGDVSGAGYGYALVDASRPYCDDCHDVAAKCDPCHGGIRLPHDDEFIIGGGHARPAAFEGKKVCWKCHSPEMDCGPPCHSGFKRSGITGHPPTWKTIHGAGGSAVATCGCHQRVSSRRGPMCALCH